MQRLKPGNAAFASHATTLPLYGFASCAHNVRQSKRTAVLDGLSRFCRFRIMRHECAEGLLPYIRSRRHALLHSCVVRRSASGLSLPSFALSLRAASCGQ